MTIPEAQGWVFIISTVTTGVIGIIGAWFARKAAVSAKENTEKSDVIHTIVNSAMTELRARNDVLQSLVVAGQREKEMAEHVREQLAHETAKAVAVKEAVLAQAGMIPPAAESNPTIIIP